MLIIESVFIIIIDDMELVKTCSHEYGITIFIVFTNVDKCYNKS